MNRKLMSHRRHLERSYSPEARRADERAKKEEQTSIRSELGCQPVFILCAITCLITVGFTKGPEISSYLHNLNPKPTVAPIPFSVAYPNRPTINRPALSRIPGLSASKSTITGFADTQSMTAAYYWTMTLKNGTRANQEAQMVISVPKGSTVSRATLWVNGIPQEAAFSSTAQVTRAYEWVKNGREMPQIQPDPLIVTQESPGVLLVKASPVLANGPEMRIRLGFTAPLKIAQNNQATLEMPYVHDSNFSIDSKQDVHIESQTAISSNDSSVVGERNKNQFLLRGNIAPEQLFSLNINVERTTGDAAFATRATHSPQGTYILANYKQDSNGRRGLTLRKVTTKPDCRIIDSEPAAHRLSTLWAYAQIEALVKQGNPTALFRANRIAEVHRVVSSVSGATVLERDSDYDYTGLHRNMYTTLDYTGAITLTEAGGAPEGESFDAISAQQAYPRVEPVAPSPAPVPIALPTPDAPSALPPPSAPMSAAPSRAVVQTEAPAPGFQAEQQSIAMGPAGGIAAPSTRVPMSWMSNRLQAADKRSVAPFLDTTMKAVAITSDDAAAPEVVQNDAVAADQSAELLLLISQAVAWLLGATLLLHGLVHRSTTVMVTKAAGLDGRSRATIGTALIAGGFALPSLVSWIASMF